MKNTYRNYVILALFFLCFGLIGCNEDEGDDNKNTADSQNSAEEAETIIAVEQADSEETIPPLAQSEPYLSIERPFDPDALTICSDGLPDQATTALQAAVDTWNAVPLRYADEPIPAQQADFLSALLHELGHQLGIRQHIPGQQNVLFFYLPGYGGVRRSVTAEDMALLPSDAPTLALVPNNETCSVRISLGRTEFTNTLGQRVTAACLSYYHAVVCNTEFPWYYIAEDSVQLD